MECKWGVRAGHEREERVSKGKETTGFVPFGLRREDLAIAARARSDVHAEPRCSGNFKYVWLEFI